MAKEDVPRLERKVIGPRNTSVSPGRSGRGVHDATVYELESEAGVYDNKLLSKYVKWLNVGYYLDGSDLVFLECEASGELTTLLLNSLVNAAMQLRVLRRLKNIRMGSFLRPVSLSVVGDEVEIIFLIYNMSITSPDVDQFLNFLESEFATFGQELSKEKTFICPLSAKYVQTFARFGLYIYKDQIMNIASEKP